MKRAKKMRPVFFKVYLTSIRSAKLREYCASRIGKAIEWRRPQL